MRRRPASAWAWWGAFAAIAVLGLSLRLAYGRPDDDHAASAIQQLSVLGAFAVFATVGALILSRRPRHPIGAIYLGGALAAATGTLTRALIDVDVATPGRLPAAPFVWLADDFLSDLPLVAVVSLPLLLFPDGTLPSRRWRPIFAVAVACLALVAARSFVPGTFDNENAPTNPLGIPGAKGVLEQLSILGVFVLALIVVAAIVSLFVRFRRSTGAEQQQLKWLGWAGVWTLILLFMSGPGTFSGMFGATVSNFLYIFVPYFFAAAFALIPLATAVAILRYRLYDIDRIVSRTITYGVITGLLIGVYVGLVVTLQRASESVVGSSDLAVAASTLIVAALFVPLRRRVQSTVDRRFNRARYDVARTIEAFSAKLREETQLETLTGELEDLVRRTMQPTDVKIWLRR